MRYRTIVADPPWELEASPTEWQTNGETLPYRSMTVADMSALSVGDYAAAGSALYLWTINQRLRDAFLVVDAWGFVPVATLVWCKPPRGLSMGGKFASNVEFIFYCRDVGGIRRVTSYLADAADVSGVSAREVDLEFGTNGMAGHWLSRSSQPAIPAPHHWSRLKALLRAGDEMDSEVADYHLHDGAAPLVDSRWWVWPRGAHSQKPEAFYDLVEQASPGPYLELFARRNRLGWDTWGNESLEMVQL